MLFFLGSKPNLLICVFVYKNAQILSNFQNFLPIGRSFHIPHPLPLSHCIILQCSWKTSTSLRILSACGLVEQCRTQDHLIASSSPTSLVPTCLCPWERYLVSFAKNQNPFIFLVHSVWSLVVYKACLSA